MIIGISGGMHIGKTTLADKLVEHEYFTKLSMAGPLKQLAWELDMPLTRTYMQRLGQGARDIVYPDIWVDAMKWRIKEQAAEGNLDIVIDDIRYPNELALCDIVIRLDGFVSTQWERFQTSDKFTPHKTYEEFLSELENPTETSIPVDQIVWDARVDTMHIDPEQVFYSVREQLQMIDVEAIS